MKIVEVETIPVHQYVFVKVHTDVGITGLGESGVWGHLEASQQAVETFKRYLIGQDPRRIEQHWQVLYRWSHFRGAAIMGALSAIDIALWDILGKHLDVPCYQLLGGKCRDKARVYTHVLGATADDLIQGCIAARAHGYTAVGHLNPFLDEPYDQPYFKTHAAKMEDAIDVVRRCREAVGNAVDLCLEIHRRLTPAEAVVFAQGVAQFQPFFYEDPTRPGNFDAMAEIAQKITIPIATGERLNDLWEFAMLLKRSAVQYVRPDVCMCGGLTYAKKIAAVAEAHYVEVVPHNPLSPVSTAACVQLAASIPNFALQEYPSAEWQPPKRDIVKQPLRYADGFVFVPDAPGIGVELAEDAQQRHPPQPRAVRMRPHVDGSVVEQ